jgi:carbamate kinase
LEIPVCSIITQTIVDERDPAFLSPSKPIGRFYTESEAKALAAEKGYKMKEDAGRGWRRVVASPKPIGIAEKETIKALLANGQVVIAAGGGGIPVRRQGNHLAGANAVVDKDYAAAVLADIVDADALVILTAVDKAALDFNKPEEKKLDRMTAAAAQRYADDGQFAPGSMLPKVLASIQFVSGERERPRKAVICHLENASKCFDDKTGTIITKN